MKKEQFSQVIRQIKLWAVNKDDITAAALVGSWARNTAREDSDIDLIFLTTQPLRFRITTEWINEINWGDYRIVEWHDADYGAVWSRHVQIGADGLSDLTVEFSFGELAWASTNPIDAGTRRVVIDGCCILYDPEEILLRLVRQINCAL